MCVCVYITVCVPCWCHVSILSCLLCSVHWEQRNNWSLILCACTHSWSIKLILISIRLWLKFKRKWIQILFQLLICFFLQELGGLCKAGAAEGHPDLPANSLLALQAAFSAGSKKHLNITNLLVPVMLIWSVADVWAQCCSVSFSNCTHWRKIWCPPVTY